MAEIYTLLHPFPKVFEMRKSMAAKSDTVTKPTMELSATDSSSNLSKEAPAITEQLSSRIREENETSGTETYPSTFRVITITLALGICLFLVSMDQTIVATAAPRITDQFHSVDDEGWYASAYLLTCCMSQLLWGKAYRFFLLRQTFLVGLGVFEAGSILCAAAPTSAAFIAGRALAGIGFAGVIAGYGIILTRLVPLRKRALYNSYLNAASSIAFVTAPLIGGALTSRVSWRWCFWINLPTGGLAAAAIALFVKIDQGHTDHTLSRTAKLKAFDLPGAVTLMGAVVCLLLALQWGGTTYSWSDGREVALFVVCAITFILFIIRQWQAKDRGLTPFHVIRRRSIYCTCLYGLFAGGSGTVAEYYAIKGASPLGSGLMLLPLIIANTIAAFATGVIITWVGYPFPFLTVGAAALTIGMGLISTFTPSTGAAKWIIFQAIAGAGHALGNTASALPLQILLSNEDIPIGFAFLNLSTVLGGAIFVPATQTAFINSLKNNFSRLLGSAAGAITAQTGATQILSQVPVNDYAKAERAYNTALVAAFYVATAMAGVSFIATLGVKYNLTVKEETKTGDPESSFKENKA